MMRLYRKKDGFTLIELLIVILTGTIVTAAATTILLLAMRINRKSLDTVERQSIMRIMQSVFEDMGSDGNYEFTTDAIKVKGSETDYVLSYDAANDQLITGQGGILMENVSKFQLSATNTPFDYVSGLYTFSIESQGESYVSSVYGRTQDDNWFADDPALDYESGRNLLVDIAASQIGSTGKIQAYKNIAYGRDYNLWYLYPDPDENGKYETEYPDGWTNETPWCSVFASWVMEQTTGFGAKLDENDTRIPYLKSTPRQATVNILWLEAFAQTDAEHMRVNNAISNTFHIPQSGDLIFFEYGNEEEDLNSTQDLSALINFTTQFQSELKIKIQYVREHYMVSKLHHFREEYTHKNYLLTYEEYSNLRDLMKAAYVPYDLFFHGGIKIVGDGLDHVGIVAKIEYEEVDGEQVPAYVYTIEGNVITNQAAGMAKHSVMLRKYPLDDEDIFGYATLNWNEAYK